MDKHILEQYCSTQTEISENYDKIDKLEREIAKLEKDIEDIENGKVVKDKVRGGLGGLETFNIEGVPIPEYKKKKTAILSNILELNKLKSKIEDLNFKLLEQTNAVQDFITSVDDSKIRRVINYRFLENLTWTETALKFGKSVTPDSIRKEFERFLQKL